MNNGQGNRNLRQNMNLVYIIGTYPGLTITPGNVDDLAGRIRNLYQSPKRLAELAQGSRKFNERYNWTKIGAEYVALVEHLNHRSRA